MAIVADGIQYAEQVVAGEIVACELVRLACQRFLNDLEHGPKRGIYFIEDRAQHILEFYSFIPHVKGALAGKPIDLMPWHVFILINIFGFVIPLIDEQTGKKVVDEDGDVVFVRRFRTAYNEVARKNAKSTLSSGIGLYMTGADGEGGAEVYSAATTRDQARIVFEDAKNMLKKSKATLGRLFEFNKLAIYQERTASKFEPLSSDANNLDGLNIHCGIVDELHAHKTRDVWDVLETATGARLQSLLFGITTAGFNKEGICYELRDYGIKVLRGQVDDDSFFAIIYTLDKDDDPFDETVWQKANSEEIIRIVPIVMGSKRGGVFQTIFGAVLVAAAIWLPWGSALWASNLLFAVGASVAIGGVIQMLSPQPKGLAMQDQGENKPSYAFGSPTNTVSQGYPVPVLYGERTIGGAIISAGIYVEDQQ